MSLLGFILELVGKGAHSILTFYLYVLIAAIVISWVRPNTTHPIFRQIIQMIVKMTEPVFYKIRQILPRALYSTGLDFSPILVFIGIEVLKQISVKLMIVGINLQKDGLLDPNRFQNF